MIFEPLTQLAAFGPFEDHLYNKTTKLSAVHLIIHGLVERASLVQGTHVKNRWHHILANEWRTARHGEMQRPELTFGTRRWLVGPSSGKDIRLSSCWPHFASQALCEHTLPCNT